MEINIQTGSSTPFMMPIDTHSYYKMLEDAGAPHSLAEVLVKMWLKNMEHNLATKTDIEQLRLAQKTDVEELRLAQKTDIEQLRLAQKTDIEQLRLAQKADVEQLRLAQKADVEELRLEQKADVEELRRDVELLRRDIELLRRETEQLRKDTFIEIAKVKAELTLEIRASVSECKAEIIKLMVSLLFGQTAVVLGGVGWMLKIMLGHG